ncbi:MAG TPA: helix-turn-helix domain-containing protein [Candidatus Competibacteraceae bacterium]|nr:helix-turn-helix domain-containing protein [Candidatus Competibacteraceae bacterium]
MQRIYDTTGVPAPQRAAYWRQSIAAAYFPLELEFGRPEHFHGELTLSSLGDLSLSRLRSDALRYRRQTCHLTADSEEYFLLSIPELAAIEFSQLGRRTLCPPGSFVLERSGEPYEFLYTCANALQVLKLPERALRLRIAGLDRLCAMRFDARDGTRALFVEFLTLAFRHTAALGPAQAATVARQILDLLAMALQREHDVGESEESAVQAAHLRRIESYIRRHLGEPALTPAGIAAACGVSVRYLHRLFQPTGRSVGEWIRELRLEACREALVGGEHAPSIGALAYRWGFADQAHFCRAFKARYGISPGEARRLARQDKDQGATLG